ncbi:mechanosensitive ion channel family protein [Gorillibacterium massiliense]|uniref:mechanosensitive ion channel family protein n=1 Tax=Gorillibacterium massiliense TaxID=1280390 RepID=UPI0004BA04AC|nr:mechanosensitive ion channel family protein [Gorillibacterium massiliense]
MKGWAFTLVSDLLPTGDAKGFFTKATDYFTDPDHWSAWLYVVVKVLLILLLAKIVNKVAKAALRRVMNDRKRNPLRFDPRRSRTIGLLIENVVTYCVNFIAIMLILSQFNFDLGPLIAGAGVIGLAIGFGAQSIVKDVITGFFIIFEDQFAVGDVIQTGAYKGTVETIGLRITTIRAWTGEMFIIPNSQIQTVTNFSVNNSLAVVDYSFSVDGEIEIAMQEMRSILQKLHTENENVVSEPVLQGIQTLGESTVGLRVVMECQPNSQGDVIRGLNEELKTRMADKDLRIPPLKAVNYSPNEKG